MIWSRLSDFKVIYLSNLAKQCFELSNLFCQTLKENCKFIDISDYKTAIYRFDLKAMNQNSSVNECDSFGFSIDSCSII